MPLVPIEQLTYYFPGFPDLVGRVAHSTMGEYQGDLQKYLTFCGWDPDRLLQPSTLRAWRRQMIEAGLAAATINRRLAAIKSVLRSAVVHQAVDLGTAYALSLVENVRPQTLKERMRDEREALTPEEVHRIFQVPNPLTLRGVRDRALIATLAASGCRVSEVVGLRRTDVYWRGAKGTIAVRGKNQVYPRHAPLTQKAYTWLQRWLERRAHLGMDVEIIFTRFLGRGPAPSSKPMTANGAYTIVKECAALAGLPAVSPHDFRRFVATHLYESYGLLVAQRALGHKRPETTMAYIRKHTDMEGLTEPFA